MSISLLGALIHTDPEEAKARILTALRESRGDRRAAAELLETTHRSLYRHIERLQMWPAIDELIEVNNFPHVPGPPRVPQRASAEQIESALVAARGIRSKAARRLKIDMKALTDRISELDLWDVLSQKLAALGFRPLRVRGARASRRAA